MTTERVEHMAGGQGHTLVKRLLDEKQLNGKCKLYAQVTLERDVLWDIMNIIMRVKRIIFFQEKVFTVIMEHSVWCRPVM